MDEIKWRTIIENQHKRNHPKNEYKLIFRDGCIDSDIRDIEQSLSVSFPKELSDLYTDFDGFGKSAEGGNTLWFFVPLPQLINFVGEVRDWFEETHSSIAKRFLPVFDWGSGDSVGYLYNNAGEVDGLYEFNHELYEFDESQDWKEFLIKDSKNITDFLKSI